jgi:nucleotide-binding universal stress UspA family protein
MFTHIVVGVDGGQGGRDAVALAKQLAQPDSKITLANCYGETGMLRLAADRMHADSSEMLTRTAALASVDARLVSLAYASVSRGLHQFATHAAADLLVLGSCHRGTLGRALLGEHSRDVLSDAPCPVAIAPSGYARFGGQLDLLVVDSRSDSLLELLLNGGTPNYPAPRARRPLLVMPRSAAVGAPRG